jgi:hypothetical protein
MNQKAQKKHLNNRGTGHFGSVRTTQFLKSKTN